jgi:hypothetical protein
MRVQVETYVDEGGAERLRRFRLDDRVIEVAENIDQWHGVSYRYLKVGGCDGAVYILRENEVRAAWQLTAYQRSPNTNHVGHSDRAKQLRLAPKA